MLQDNAYEWQSNGILESRAKQVGATTYSEVFQHDGLNRLEQSQTYIGGVLSRTLSSSYDIRGNLSAKTSDVLNDVDVTSYNYTTGTNRLASATIGGVSTTFTTDNNGNITRYDRASGEDKFIDWNARNMPTTVVIGSSLTDTTPTAKDEFAYGPDGQRFYKKTSWDDSGTQRVEHTFYVGAFEELITDSSNPSYKAIKKTRVDSSAMHMRRTDWSDVSTDAIEYLHRDHLGSIEVTSNSGGTAINQRGYDPFGGRRTSDWGRELTAAEKKAIADGSDEPAERGYTDHEMLDRTGLIHMNGRVYDPEIGRFLSPDPIVQAPGYSQSWNRYAYVMNSPMSYTDPSGYIRQPSGAGSICSASPACLNFGGPMLGAPPGVSAFIVPITTTYVRRYVRTMVAGDDPWDSEFSDEGDLGGFNDVFGDVINRIRGVTLISVVVEEEQEVEGTQVVSATEGSETDENVDAGAAMTPGARGGPGIPRVAISASSAVIVSENAATKLAVISRWFGPVTALLDVYQVYDSASGNDTIPTWVSDVRSSDAYTYANLYTGALSALTAAEIGSMAAVGKLSLSGPQGLVVVAVSASFTAGYSTSTAVDRLSGGAFTASTVAYWESIPAMVSMYNYYLNPWSSTYKHNQERSDE